VQAAVIRVAVVGGSGYIGGELARLLLGHPEVELVATTSTQRAGRRVDGAHPNLRGLTDLTFVVPEDLPDVDVLFVAAGHGTTMDRMAGWGRHAKQVIDLSADFRLKDVDAWRRYYGTEHRTPDLLPDFVYGLPELHRDELRGADRVAVPGCMATAGILALHPITSLVAGPVSVDAKSGSSGSGISAGTENLHAERSGAMRVFAPVRHRHQAEIYQETGIPVRMTATGIEAVRGVQVVARVPVRHDDPDVPLEQVIRAAYQKAYANEPFVRVVAMKRGQYRLPEPKILVGSNFCDVGFAVDTDPATGSPEVVCVAALDNLMKGGAGNAVQSLNLRYGWPERTGLEFPGLHPV
jgi:N-acetyl-gamma-glutamyl-phosphate/LysW-gamma-L-alpha-aminoadipyl-6-phosphate reductase